MLNNFLNILKNDKCIHIYHNEKLKYFLPIDTISNFSQIIIGVDVSVTDELLYTFLIHFSDNIHNIVLTKVDVEKDYDSIIKKCYFLLINKPMHFKSTPYSFCKVLNFYNDTSYQHSIKLYNSSYITKISKIKKLSLLFGFACNTTCSYCSFLKHNHKIEKEQALSIVPHIVQLEDKIQIVKIAGGEPLIYEWLPVFVEQLLVDTNQLELEILSNGINVGFIQQLEKYANRLVIRLHTPQEIYDGYVIHDNIKYSYDDFFTYFNKVYKYKHISNFVNLVITNENFSYFYDFVNKFEKTCSVKVRAQIQTDRNDNILLTNDNINNLYHKDLVPALWTYLNTIHHNLFQYDILFDKLYISTCFQLASKYTLQNNGGLVFYGND